MGCGNVRDLWGITRGQQAVQCGETRREGHLDDDEVRARDFDGFIDKPISLAQLRDLVEQIVTQPESKGVG